MQLFVAKVTSSIRGCHCGTLYFDGLALLSAITDHFLRSLFTTRDEVTQNI